MPALFDGSSTTYEISSGSTLRVGEGLTTRLLYTLWQSGPIKISSSLTGGNGNLDFDRRISLPGLSLTAQSGTDVSMIDSMTRFSYSFGSSGFYVTPLVDIGLNHVHVDGYAETGAGALNLAIGGFSETIFSASPAVEIGSTMTTGELTYRPYLRAGVTFLSDDGFTTATHFAAAPGAGTFLTTARFDDVFADISAGIQMFGNDGMDLRINYDGHFGENSESHGGDVKLTIKY